MDCETGQRQSDDVPSVVKSRLAISGSNNSVQLRDKQFGY